MGFCNGFNINKDNISIILAGFSEQRYLYMQNMYL